MENHNLTSSTDIAIPSRRVAWRNFGDLTRIPVELNPIVVTCNSEHRAHWLTIVDDPLTADLPINDQIESFLGEYARMCERHGIKTESAARAEVAKEIFDSSQEGRIDRIKKKLKENIVREDGTISFKPQVGPECLDVIDKRLNEINKTAQRQWPSEARILRSRG